MNGLEIVLMIAGGFFAAASFSAAVAVLAYKLMLADDD
jgi:hypothetical protein